VSLKSVPQLPPDVRRLYRAENDPAALRIELAPAGIAAPPDVAIVVVDDPKLGDEREASVRIIMSPAQAARLVRMLRGGARRTGRVRAERVLDTIPPDAQQRASRIGHDRTRA
jgi:hypothetical protein